MVSAAMAVPPLFGLAYSPYNLIISNTIMNNEVCGIWLKNRYLIEYTKTYINIVATKPSTWDIQTTPLLTRISQQITV